MLVFQVILSEGDCRAITTWLSENISEGQITGSILVSADANSTDTSQASKSTGIIIKKNVGICKP